MLLDIRIPTIISKNGDKPNILEECSEDVWNAAEGATGEDAEIIVDMKCPIKLQEIQAINGIGEFSSKGFSVMGSASNTGPWKRIHLGELEEVKEEV